MKNIPQKNINNQKEIYLLLEKMFHEVANDMAEILVQNEVKYRNNEDIMPYIASINNQLSTSLDYLLSKQMMKILDR